MTEQTINEIIKAYAYGQTVEQIAEAEGVTVVEVQRIIIDRAAEIDAERAVLHKVGYIS
nr:MAG TPA: Protein of unknown function (DUF2802) [Caudoviricetes sp.]